MGDASSSEHSVTRRLPPLHIDRVTYKAFQIHVKGWQPFSVALVAKRARCRGRGKTDASSPRQARSAHGDRLGTQHMVLIASECSDRSLMRGINENSPTSFLN